MKSNLRNPANPTNNGQVHSFGLSGFPTVSFQIEGAISAGSYAPQVSNDGQTWYNISVVQSGGSIVSAVTDAGIYRADVNGYENFRLLPSNDFAGVCTVLSVASPRPLILSSDTPQGLSTSPTWQYFLITFEDFVSPDLDTDILLYSLPPRSVVHGVFLKHSEAFDAPGLESLELSIGVVGSLDLLLPPFDVSTGVSGTNMATNGTFDMRSYTGATQLRIAAFASGAFLDELTSGAVEVQLLLSTLATIPA